MIRSSYYFAIITVITLLLGFYLTRSYYVIDASQIDSEVPIGEITEEVIVEQTFIAQADNLSSIQIYFGTYNRLNTSNIEVILTNGSQTYLSEKISVENIKDNSFHKFDFTRITDSKGKKYSLIIKSDGKPGNSVTIWSTRSSAYDNGELFINNIRINSDLKFQTLSKVNSFEKLMIIFKKFPVKLSTTIILCIGLYSSFIFMLYSIFCSNSSKRS
ncbi:hypothetical protein D3C74_193180 [compost metagenome]